MGKSSSSLQREIVKQKKEIQRLFVPEIAPVFI
jgi:hypothetical protein